LLRNTSESHQDQRIGACVRGPRRQRIGD
jgi:hypothetical protein